MPDILINQGRNLTGNARTLMDGEVVTFQQILAEGQKSTPQFNEWHDIFDLQSVCNQLELSELEKWCVLGNRFRVVNRKQTDQDTLDFTEWVLKEGWQFKDTAIKGKHYHRELSYSFHGENCSPESLYYRWKNRK
jgi:hypothetical protein